MKLSVNVGATTTLDRVAIIEAAQQVLDTEVGSPQGKGVRLQVLTDRLGTTQNIRQGAQAVARALLQSNMTFHEAITKPRRLLPSRVDHAITHFCFLLHDDRELADTNQGHAHMLLMQMDEILTERIQEARRDSGRLAS